MSVNKSHRQEYLYTLLDRLKTDCDYYLGNGNHHPQSLWAGDEAGQISKMKEIWSQLDEKPEWLTLEEIQNYARKMGVDNIDIKEESLRDDRVNYVIQLKNDSDAYYSGLSYDINSKLMGFNITYNIDNAAVFYTKATAEAIVQDIYNLKSNSDLLEIVRIDPVNRKKVEESISAQDTIKNINVYQLKNPGESGYGFMPYNFTEDKLNLNDYEMVASISIETNAKDPNIVLEAAFAYGNMNKDYFTENPSARSISVSDILEYNGDKYYVDSLGFIKLDSTKLQEANINTEQNNKIDLEKEKEEVEQQLKDVEELQTKKNELEDKIDELLEEDESRKYIINVDNPDEVVDDESKFFDIAFQLDKLSIFEVEYNKLSSNKNFPPDFTTSGGKLEKNKRDWEYAGQCQDELLEKFPEAKKFYEKWDNKHLKYLRQNEYEEMLKDLEVLKNKYNYILKQPTDDKGILFSEEVRLSKEPLKKSNITESLNKELKLKEFDVLISLDDSVSEESIDNEISNSIEAVGGELIDISEGKPQDWNETKFTVKANLPVDLVEHKLDEKIADSIFDLGAEVVDISYYRELTESEKDCSYGDIERIKEKKTEDQYENERRRGIPPLDKIAETEYYDNQDWYDNHIKNYKNIEEFITENINDIAYEYNLKPESAEKVCKKIFELASKDGLDKYLRKINRECKKEDYEKLEEEGFPSTEATKKELTPIEIRQIKLAEYLTDEQKNYLINNIDTLENIQEHLDKLGKFYSEFRDDFQEEEIMSIDEYVDVYKNKFKKGNN